MSDVPPSLPFRLAAAYSNGPSASASGGGRSSSNPGIPGRGKTTQPDRSADRATLSSPAPQNAALIAEKIRRLVAAQVGAPAPQAAGSLEAKPLAQGFDDPLRPLQMYRNPAAKNAAATAVEAGRLVDLEA
jgi:hypothetical protein